VQFLKMMLKLLLILGVHFHIDDINNKNKTLKKNREIIDNKIVQKKIQHRKMWKH